MTSSGSMPAYGGGSDENKERGSRRRKVAGFLKAANELRQSYTQQYSQKWGGEHEDDDDLGIPGAFPDVAIVRNGDEQLVLFPSYAKRHTKEQPKQPDIVSKAKRYSSSDSEGASDAEYWAREWKKFEDDRAVVDVDVRGWIYSPHRGPMSRKNRMLIGLARRLSGVPAPAREDSVSTSRETSPGSQSLRKRHEAHEALREQQRIAREAENILQKGQDEEDAAMRGGYSENPKGDSSDTENIYDDRGRRGGSPDEPPGPGQLAKRTSWNQPSDMTTAELQVANANLMARLKPFLTNPLVSTPITIFFYNDKTSVSRTVTTNDAGHFTLRAPLEFVPTHVRVLASENLSATEEVKITEMKGVSLISDVDDTIKHTSIGSGARETFRNAFIRDLKDLTIDGVKEWYNTMYDMGVGIHYVSNAPWQLFPVLVSYFQVAGLPPGSYHLKQYSGMLQGIFEPVAERKKGTLERILRDFPERKFLLNGDSGEADLEVYTEVVLANPGRVLGIFIRDVTTPEHAGFFDAAMGPLTGNRKNDKFKSQPEYSRTQTASIPHPAERRPILPPRIKSEAIPQTSSGPRMGKLIDIDDEPELPKVHNSHRTIMPRSTSDFEALDSPRRHSDTVGLTKTPPPRPSKPLSLRSQTTQAVANSLEAAPISRGTPPPPPKPRRAKKLSDPAYGTHPLAHAYSTEDLEDSDHSYVSSARNKISAAYNVLPEVRSYLPGAGQRTNSNTSINSDKAPPPPPRHTATASSTSQSSSRLSWGTKDADISDDDFYAPSSASSAPVNKKLELWKRRWKAAKDVLDAQGVPLRSWRRGQDICVEAVQLIEKEMTKMGVEGYGSSKGKTGEGGGEVKVKDIKR
ncbi:actin patch protein 1 [Coleophoma crateriformis]|uniref:Actin patch protein 1 n=1 Tax=Coleophoma crateriformis TaxID=565419 RepID=A0A3D8SAE0_9HELO|nr:actin patch protein 1 [Coleophoma crateriformis]